MITTVLCIPAVVLWKVAKKGWPGGHFTMKTPYQNLVSKASKGICIIEIRLSHDGVISKMGIPCLKRCHLYWNRAQEFSTQQYFHWIWPGSKTELLLTCSMLHSMCVCVCMGIHIHLVCQGMLWTHKSTRNHNGYILSHCGWCYYPMVFASTHKQ